MQRNKRFDALLDECYDPMKIGEVQFFPSDVLFACDPIAYRVYASDYMSELEDDDDER